LAFVEHLHLKKMMMTMMMTIVQEARLWLAFLTASPHHCERGQFFVLCCQEIFSHVSE
jgi:serine/threonine protein phosphatase PrpC